MYLSKPGLIIGFHGCDESVAASVVKGKKMLKASKNDYDWLGNGIYFWENNQERALDFAKELAAHPRKDRPKISKPAVIGAVIDLGYCLDLVDAQFLRLLKNSYQSMISSLQALSLQLPANKRLEHPKNSYLEGWIAR